jgi:LysM repeat protein
MIFKRMSIFVVLLLLAGCYQQANDSFETTTGSTTELATPTLFSSNPADLATPVVIVPGQENNTPVPTEDATTVPVQPTNQDPQFAMGQNNNPSTSNTTPTVVIIVPSLPTNTPSTSLLPTATPPTLITPQAPSQLILPTATPISVVNAQGTQTIISTNGIQTPTALPLPTNAACVYVVQGGDNLFRIAISNNASLADLLALNSLSEQSIIQPGQELQLPNCDDGSTNAALPTVVPNANSGNTVPATLESGGTGTVTTGVTGNQVIHVVASGETLSTIAQRYGVTIQDIVTANNLDNPDRLSLGQELIIPNQ